MTRAFRAIAALSLALSAWIAPEMPVRAERVTVFYNLCSHTDCSEGFYPSSTLLADAQGNLYGTTLGGGAGGAGTVFKLSPMGTGTALHSFSFGSGANGLLPYGQLLADTSGNLYGTTLVGGASVVNCFGMGAGFTGCGTVFKLSPDGTQTVLYAPGPIGANPSGLAFDKTGNLYGTTVYGGAIKTCVTYGCGTVYELTTGGRKKVLHAFGGGNDGAYPRFLMEYHGSFYGVTAYGGSTAVCTESGNIGCGTVYKLMPDGTTTILYTFLGGSDGARPESQLIADSAGNLYGTTMLGGGSNKCLYGCGTVFELASNGVETVLYAFKGGRDGAWPLTGPLYRNAATGALSGTTSHGGNDVSCPVSAMNPLAGCGTLYKLNPPSSSSGTWTESVLHRLDASVDGEYPPHSLVDIKGHLYTTTNIGGVDGSGTVLALKR